MKLLIVDDEEHVREGIELAIDWSSYQIDRILMAEHGLEALELVREHHPEIIICDMSMHIMDGPQFLEKLREEGWTSKVIVLSGYQEFSYTRATLLANGVDYLLKPFKINDLEKAVQKALAQVKKEQDARLKELSTAFKLNEVNQLYNEQRFSNLIEEEKLSLKALSSFLSELGLDPKALYAATFLPRNKEHVIKQYYARDEQLFNFAAKNIIQELVSPIGPSYVIHYEAFIILLMNSRMLPEDIEHAVLSIQKAWQRILRLSSFVGFQRQQIDASGLIQALSEQRSMILSSNILNESISRKPASHSNAVQFFIDKEFVILEALRTKNKDYLSELIAEFTEDLSSKQVVSLRELQHYTVEINLLLMRIYTQLKDERLHETMPLWLSQLDEWSMKLSQIFYDIIDKIDYNKVVLQTSNPILAVRNFINDHMKEDITLASLADRFHISPQYLAKRFKEEYQTTVMNYLTQLRMEKACSLLMHTDLSIQQIAAESGFVELNYFSKVFRKHVGLSPSSYRKKNKA